MAGIDIHTHALHPKIAHKVLLQLEDHYGIHPVGTGFIEDLLERAQAAGLEGVVVHNAATAPAQVIPANNWILELMQRYPQVRAFGTLHPDYPQWEKELERLRAAGAPGLKFHPEFQGFRMDDSKILPLIEAAEKDFVFMLHVGDRLPPEENPSCPYKVRRLMDQFPRARFIAAHLGGYLHWEHALECLIGQEVYIDTSSSLPFLDQTTLEKIFNRHPREYILFGSDYPLFDPGATIDSLRTRLRLKDAELEQILTNGERLMGN